MILGSCRLPLHWERLLTTRLPALARAVDKKPVVVHSHHVAADVIVAIALLFAGSPGGRTCSVPPRLRFVLARTDASVEVLLEVVEVLNGRRRRRSRRLVSWWGPRWKYCLRVEHLGHQEAHPAWRLVAESVLHEVAAARPASREDCNSACPCHNFAEL